MPAQLKLLKKYGQNFLTNKTIAIKIINAFDITGDDIIVEIGAGSGVLTDIITQKEYKDLYALEIDPRFIAILKEKYYRKINIIRQSILDFSFKDLALQYNQKITIIGNIPYNITSPIIFKLIENYKYISYIVLMVQKEIADRLLAGTHCKAYGILSVLAGSHAKILQLFNVKKNNFYPIPKVDSTVIKMEMYENINDIDDYSTFKKIVHVCFNTRRKMLQNSLKRFLPIDIINQIKSVPLTARPEELSIQDFKNLSNETLRIIGNNNINDITNLNETTFNHLC